VIVDASALLVSLADAKAARALRGAELSAPDLLIPETLNAFWRLARAKRKVPERAVILTLLDQIRIVPSRPYAARAADLAEQLDHPVYDCLYLALAEADSDILITADVRFARKIRAPALRKRVRLIGQRTGRS
jgi:predicted nucleic acid-binding protein